MEVWEKYCDDVLTGKIPAGEPIKLAAKRFNVFKERDDVYFDELPVKNCIKFVSLLRHFKSEAAGKPFKLEPWQQFIVANIFGLKWKSNGKRLCRTTYIQIARKAGKDAFMAALSLYLMIADGEPSAEVGCLGNTREQARILFDYISTFAKQLDGEGKSIKQYRNYITLPANLSKCSIFSSDASKLDGLNLSAFFVDEYHEAKDRKLFDVMASSQTMRSQPLAGIITTAGYNLESPCHDMYMLGIEVLNNIKQDDTFFPFIWQMDTDDDWTDEKNFVKCQPNLGVTVSVEAMNQEVVKAKNDATAEVGVKTKTFNIWCQSASVWIPQSTVVKCMAPVKLEDFEGCTCVIGQDLATVSDFSSISVLIEKDEMHYFKTFTFLPEETYKNHANRELYKKFVQEGSMIVTPGNCTDYDFIIAKIGEINNLLRVKAIYTDTWNATQEMIKLGELGYDVQPFSQAIGNFSGPTKEFERLVREQKVVIDKSANVLWQIGNVTLAIDHNGNTKPNKGAYGKKIDSVISMITALGGMLKNPVKNDFFIWAL